jgi:hypothetical protein
MPDRLPQRRRAEFARGALGDGRSLVYRAWAMVIAAAVLSAGLIGGAGTAAVAAAPAAATALAKSGAASDGEPGVAVRAELSRTQILLVPGSRIGVQFRLFDAEGNRVALDHPVAVTTDDPSVVSAQHVRRPGTDEPHLAHPDIVDVRARENTGTATVTVSYEGFTASVTVTNAVLSSGTRTVEDAGVIFPLAPETPGSSPTEPPIPGLADGKIGAFTVDEVVSQFTQDGDYPVVVRDTSIRVGAKLVSSGNRPIAGVVERVLVRDGQALVTLSTPAITEIFRELDLSLVQSTPYEFDLGDEVLQADSDDTARALADDGAPKKRCETEAGGSAGTVKFIAGKATIAPVWELDVQIADGVLQEGKLKAGIRPELTLKPSIDLKGEFSLGVKCKFLDEPIEVAIAAGPLGAFLSGKFKMEPVFEASVTAEAGPNIAAGVELKLGGEASGGFTYDTVAGLKPESTFSLKPSFTPFFTADGVSVDELLGERARAKVEVNAGLFKTASAGFQIGGATLDTLKRLTGWIPGLGDKVAEIEDALWLDLLSAKAGGEIKAAWASPGRVLASSDEGSEITASLTGEIKLRSNALNKLLEKLKISTKLLDITIASGSQPIASFFRGVKPGPIELTRDGEPIAGGIVSAGDTVSVVAQPTLDPVPLPVTDGALTGGTLWLRGDRVSGFSMSPRGEELVGQLVITDELCEQLSERSDLTLLGYRSLVGIPAAGQVGSLKLQCVGEFPAPTDSSIEREGNEGEVIESSIAFSEAASAVRYDVTRAGPWMTINPSSGMLPAGTGGEIPFTITCPAEGGVLSGDTTVLLRLENGHQRSFTLRTVVICETVTVNPDTIALVSRVGERATGAVHMTRLGTALTPWSLTTDAGWIRFGSSSGEFGPGEKTADVDVHASCGSERERREDIVTVGVTTSAGTIERQVPIVLTCVEEGDPDDPGPGEPTDPGDADEPILTDRDVKIVGTVGEKFEATVTVRNNTDQDAAASTYLWAVRPGVTATFTASSIAANSTGTYVVRGTCTPHDAEWDQALKVILASRVVDVNLSIECTGAPPAVLRPDWSHSSGDGWSEQTWPGGVTGHTFTTASDTKGLELRWRHRGTYTGKADGFYTVMRPDGSILGVGPYRDGEGYTLTRSDQGVVEHIITIWNPAPGEYRAKYHPVGSETFYFDFSNRWLH